jgi:hypothetical protein
VCCKAPNCPDPTGVRRLLYNRSHFTSLVNIEPRTWDHAWHDFLLHWTSTVRTHGCERGSSVSKQFLIEPPSLAGRAGTVFTVPWAFGFSAASSRCTGKGYICTKSDLSFSVAPQALALTLAHTFHATAAGCTPRHRK